MNVRGRIAKLEALAAGKRAAGCANSPEGRRHTAALILTMFERSALLSIDSAGIVGDCEGFGVPAGLHRDCWAEAIATEGDYPAAFARLASMKEPKRKREARP